MTKKINKVALVTGSAGFIGFHVSKSLLQDGWKVIGLDCISDYYDISLKKNREAILLQSKRYYSIHKKLEEVNVLKKLFEEETPNLVIHLAAQAGVRYSINNPRTFLESNMIGTFELLEAARRHPPQHMLLASTSSIYGSNPEMPFKETDRTDHQMSFYAATKKSMESMAHSYSYLFGLPITVFRFFTVYGPWGRPDMAIFKFTKAILDGEEIDVYNHGDMKRDFTYINDLVKSIELLFDAIPEKFDAKGSTNYIKHSGTSSVAPFRVLNIGASKPETLLNLIKSLEQVLDRKAYKNFTAKPIGDVKETWSDASLLEELTGYRPSTSLIEGLSSFTNWYRDYYNA